METLIQHLTYLVMAVLAVPVAVLGVGRLGRIVIYDAFPPAIWLRIRWDRLTGKSSWNKLLHCPWCIMPWIALAAIGWYVAGLFVLWLAWAWWIFWGWMAISYLASMVYVRDDPNDR